MADVLIKHRIVTNGPSNPRVLVDGPAWDDAHVITGLENVDNTSDINKPVSTAQAAAIAAGVAGVTKASLGLGSVDNTSDIDKPVSTAQAAAIAAAVGSGGGGVTKASIGLGNVDNTSDATKNAAVATLTNKTLTSPVINSPTGIVKADVGLANVDNTSDANKPVSTAQSAAITAAVGGVTKASIGLSNVDNTSDATKNAAVATLSNKTFVAPVLGAATATSLAASGQVSGSQLLSSAANANIVMISSGRAADQNVWDTLHVGNLLSFRALNDAFNVASTWMTVTRGAGATVSGVEIESAFAVTGHTTFNLNGTLKFDPSTGAGFWHDSSTTAQRFFVGTDTALDAWRIFAAGGGFNAITVSGAGVVAMGGTQFVPSSFVPVAGLNTVLLDYVGPSIAHNPADASFPSGTPTSAAHRMFYAQHAGGHSTQAQETLAILSRPVGSGANGPGAMDAALTLSAIKQNFGTTGVQGQVDGVSIYVRNGGTDGVPSDSIGVEANIASMGQTGDVFGFEMLSTNFNRSSTVIWQTDIQGGVIDAIGGHMWGFVAAAWTGAGTAAFLAQETAPGSWGFFFQGINSSGVTTFAVDRGGTVSCNGLSIGGLFTINNDPWLTSTPTVSISGGSGTATCRFKQLAKIVHFKLVVTVTAGGTNPTVTLPIPIKDEMMAFGRERVHTGVTWQLLCSGAGATISSLLSATNTATVATGDAIIYQGSYEAN